MVVPGKGWNVELLPGPGVRIPGIPPVPLPPPVGTVKGLGMGRTGLIGTLISMGGLSPSPPPDDLSSQSS